MRFKKKWAWASLSVILGCIWVAMFWHRPPAALPLDAPLSKFSAARAMEHVIQIAQKPRPTGSVENEKVRNYIYDTLLAMGLSPQIQSTNAQAGQRFSNIHNVIVKLPGTEGKDAVLLIAHYDSTPTTTGAADDGSGVGTLLETLRVLQEGSAMKNSVIVLFTDGEENGLQGARAFQSQHPWSQEVVLAVNFDGSGHQGGVYLSQTSANNRWLIQEMAKAVPHPFISSITVALSRIDPPNSDFQVFYDAGITGMFFSQFEDESHLHSMLDRPEHLDPRTLQHQGSYALGMARHFGGITIDDPREGDAVYFNVVGTKIVHYADYWVLPLMLLVCGIWITTMGMGFRKQILTIKGVVIGCIAFLVILVVAPFIIKVVWDAITSQYEFYSQHLQDVYYKPVFFFCFLGIVLFLFSTGYSWLLPKVGIHELTTGVQVWWSLGMIITSITLPGASYFLTWPLLFSLLGTGYHFYKNHEAAHQKANIITLLSSIPIIVLLVPIVYVVFLALEMRDVSYVIAVLVLLLGILLPTFSLIINVNRWILSVLGIAMGLGSMGFAHVKANFDDKHPKTNVVIYGMNANTGEAIWAGVSSRKNDREAQDEWTRQFFSDTDKRKPLSDYYFVGRPPRFFQTTAPRIDAEAPHIEVLADHIEEKQRVLQLKVTSPRKALNMLVLINGEIEKSWVDGKSSQGSFGYVGFPQNGIELEIHLKAGQPLSITLVDLSLGLPEFPEKPIQPRPAYLIREQSGGAYFFSDATIIRNTFTF